MGKITDWFVKFKTIYREVTKEQREAKTKINKLQSMCDKLDYVYDALKKVKGYLDETYLYLPNDVRQSIIQGALDFLVFGTRYKKVEFEKSCRIVLSDNVYYSSSYSYIVAIECLNNDLKHYLELMKTAYKRGGYSLDGIYKDAIERLDKFKERYEITSKDFSL